MDFTTKGMELWEREELLKKVNPIPIGTICYEAGDFSEYTKQIVVNEDNQKQVTMFWNSIYFLEKEKADYVTNQAHADYGDWLFGNF